MDPTTEALRKKRETLEKVEAMLADALDQLDLQRDRVKRLTDTVMTAHKLLREITAPQ